MFKKILIANRGEIACRIIRTCRDLGIRTVAVYSDVDRSALHVLLADEAHPIGPAPSIQSYLNVDSILRVAIDAGVDAIHPGYGFLSENPQLVDACDRAGVVFVGPPVHAMQVMGEKTLARRTMQQANVPVVPGTEAVSESEVAARAAEVGFPVMLKAAAGGGGKGMRVVTHPEDVVVAFQAAQRTARSSFGDDRVYIERYIKNPRHVEIQVLADHFGNAVYLFERECSVQRRHQKIIEEAPATRLSDETRHAMGKIAVSAALAIGYRNAGTCEFLVNDDEDFFFLEMNTRLQVEHPVTELITGTDLVAEQLYIASGEPLRLGQEELHRRGHAIECRVCAEDPEKNFLPSPGIIQSYRIPEGPGVRVDGGVYAGALVPQYYDPLIAKLVVWGPTRSVAIARTLRALSEFHVGGIRTNIPLLKAVLQSEPFVSGHYDTGVLDHVPFLAKPDLSESGEHQASWVAALSADDALFMTTGMDDTPASQTEPNLWRILGRRAALDRGVG